jgi:hypothetical protein
MPNVDAAMVARWVQGWSKVRGDEWRTRIEREQAEKAQAAREAEEEERAREAREAAAARDKATARERVSEIGEEVEIQHSRREGGNDEEESTGSATAEKACRSVRAKMMGAASQDAAAERPVLGISVVKGMDGDGEDVGVEIEEVEGIRLGPEP